MEKRILRNYIQGKASAGDRAAVLAWTEESEANLAEYRFLHLAYAAALVNDEPARPAAKIPSFRAWGWAAAACIAVLLMLFTLRPSNISVQSVCAPVGQQTRVDLSDGTAVWLNSGSSIEFGDLDRQRIRKVRLTGEAFFSVAKDAKRPFVVCTQDFDVKVLGTRFNVNTYHGDKTVVLVDGAVDVMRGRDRFSISPGEMFTYDSQNNESRIAAVQTDNYVSWVNGYLLFDNIGLDVVLSQLQSFFGIAFEYDRARASETRVSGKLELRDGLDTALLNLKNTAILTYEKSGDDLVKIRIND